MAKKFVRGITDVKTINNQDFDTNNVNDLLSDGQYNYIHRKKGKNEEYHNLTDNIKTISSDNTELLTVTNNNKTTNTATLHPKHDKQKEQVLESTRNTITIHHGENGTDEKTTVDTNPKKVLEHENLLTGYGLRKDTSNNQTTITMDTASVPDGFDLNNFNSGLVRASYFTNAPLPSIPFYVVALGTVTGSVLQIALKRLNSNDEINQMFLRTKLVGTNNWSDWKQYGVDSNTLNTILAGKQNTLIAGEGITIQGQTISATGGGAPVEGATSSLKFYQQQGQSAQFEVYKHTITQPVTNGDTSGRLILTRYTFYGGGPEAEIVLTGELKEELEPFFTNNISISNSALTITNDGTNIKLMNSKSTEQVFQQATFTFFSTIRDSGGDSPSN